MCGIAGYLNLSGAPVDRSVLADMIGMLGHRGPDERGIYVDGSVGLAHARLSIIDIVLTQKSSSTCIKNMETNVLQRNRMAHELTACVSVHSGD